MNTPTKLLLAFSIAAGVTAGGVIGVHYLRQQKTDSAKTAVTTTQNTSVVMPRKVLSDAGVEARVIEAYADSVVDVRLHPWVGEYELARVAIKGSRAAQQADAVAVLSDSLNNETAQVKAGQKIFLHGLERRTIAKNDQIPVISASKDIVAGPVRARVTRLIDGDTFEAVADIGGGNYVVTHVRVGGIDTPEKKGRAKCPEEAALAAKASALTASLIEGREVSLLNIQFEKYGGRVLGDVQLPDGRQLADVLVKNGFARPYDGGKKQSWCGL